MSLKNRYNKITKELAISDIGSFDKSGNIFYYKLNEKITWLIDMQPDRWNDSNEYQFTINLGIYVAGLMEIFIGRGQINKIGIERCAISTRLGILTEDNMDMWWKIEANGSEAQDQEIINQINSFLKTYAISFFNRFRDIGSIVKFLSTERNPKEKYFAPQSEAYSLTYAAIISRLDNKSQQANMLIERALSLKMPNNIQKIIKNISERLISN